MNLTKKQRGGFFFPSPLIQSGILTKKYIYIFLIFAICLREKVHLRIEIYELLRFKFNEMLGFWILNENRVCHLLQIYCVCPKH